MENQYNVSSPVYTIFPSDTSPNQLHSSDTIISTNSCTGSFMLPSPKYTGVKQPNAFRNTQQSLLIQPQDAAASLFYSPHIASVQPIPLSVDISNQQFSSSIFYPLNGFKVECSNNLNDSMAVTQEDAIDSKVHFVSTTNPYDSSYPPTPTTPRNESFFPMTPPIETNPAIYYDRGQYFLHFAKPRDPFQAFKNFIIATNLGSQQAKHQVAYCLQHGIGVEKDEKKAIEIYLENANSDPPIAASLCQLGICFQMGIGVEVDPSRAVKYYERAVHIGNLDAMFNLAYCLRRGIGTPVDYQHAYNLYLRLAELGDPQGMKFAGNCYSAGIGTLKNEAEATKWFHRSSECDHYWGGKMEYALLLYESAMSAIELGHVPFDFSASNFMEAYRLIREVCENFPSSPGPNKLILGKFYHFGIGCQKDFQKALHWYEKALNSYFMSPQLIQECESLINDIHQIFDTSLSTAIKNEILIGGF
ncbi:23908_t:CDS:2 [Cetraspora pellucida]|uniref:23908_t:CDS:1 n=1 Tax=Cetraspora pellucida TaxID=1433469 RepID=A0A9N9HRG4_9GLOM|nr:23908_t:CDS:2 [Cetraspora pellucida]